MMIRFVSLLLSLFVYFVTISGNGTSNSATNRKKIVYLPLDERFTTRDLLLNLGKITPFDIETPDKNILSKWKTPADLSKIDKFIEDRIPYAHLLLISAETYLYGGLIASRISNDTTTDIEKRLEKLFSYGITYPDLQIYVSNVVQRIPSYNGDFEEPWYWADYGFDLYTYSFYTDKYSQTNDINDYYQAQAAKVKVPSSAVNEFVWRRARNHNITMQMLSRMRRTSNTAHNIGYNMRRVDTDTGSKSIFNFLYTTLDDSAEYGFNIREAAEIKSYIEDNSMEIDESSCPVYPGADEVHLTMLAKYAVETARGGKRIRMSLAFKNESTISMIPSYEGQPMIETLNQQISAAGGIVVSDYSENNAHLDAGNQYDTVLLVNNFEGDSQLEASSQPTSLSHIEIEKYRNQFDAKVKEAVSEGNIYMYIHSHFTLFYVYTKLRGSIINIYTRMCCGLLR